MVKKIILNYGKIKNVCLVGPGSDIHQLYLIFQNGYCFRIYVKGFFYMQQVAEPVHHGWEAIQITDPETAYQKLVYCDYVHPDKPILKACNSTLQAILDLLLESI